MLIHVNPDFLLKSTGNFIKLPLVTFLSVSTTARLQPVAYRGHQDKLFKRDFAGEMLDAFQDLELVAYQSVYHRDPHFPADDVTWFLMQENRSAEKTYRRCKIISLFARSVSHLCEIIAFLRSESNHLSVERDESADLGY